MKKIIFTIFLISLIFITACQEKIINEDSEHFENDPVACPANFAPVCCDGQEYGNQCMADANNEKSCVEGPCPTNDCVVNENAACTREYDPYCCDGVDYSNKCMADNACGQNCVSGTCDDIKTETEPGCVPKLDAICTFEWMPLCCNGVTYGNQCQADNNCAFDCIEGECA